jgi:hypothetical protein
MTNTGLANPYLIEGPALISFSGGRTSAYMLKQILDGHGGALPDDVQVCFANTGKELPETLDFVREVERRWDVKVHWVEYRGGERKTMFAEVDFETSSRKGEPFDLLVDEKTALPNWQARWCTKFLKVEVMFAYMASVGFAKGTYEEVIGLRADEPRRLARMAIGNELHGSRCIAPLARAGVTKRDVLTFWLGPTMRLGREEPQGFDLGLESGEGNCDLCFMKGKGLKMALMRKRPWLSPWWIGKEVDGRFFDRRTRYVTLAADVDNQHELLPLEEIAEEHEVECGLFCAGDDEIEAGVDLNRGCGRRAA